MHDIRYDAVHDEIFVTNPFAEAVLVFRGGADGEEAPIRIIQGIHTQLDTANRLGGGYTVNSSSSDFRYGGSSPDRLEEDPVHNEIFVPASDRILVFPRDGNGDVPPVRVLSGPDTKLNRAASVAVDPVHNLMIVGAGPIGSMRLLIYNRTDNGNAKPLAVIEGPSTGLLMVAQLQVYSPKGWIVVAQQGKDPSIPEPGKVFVGVWSIHDNGDVPPRWKIGGPKSTLMKPRGVALNPRNKELIVADMSLNSALVYYFPEMF